MSVGSFGDAGIGSRLKAARELGGISARELDRLAGLSEGYSAMIESGARPDPGSNVSRQLAATLGLSLDWLISGIGPSPTAKTAVAAIAKCRKPNAR